MAKRPHIRPKVRQMVLRMFDYTCQVCGAGWDQTAELHIDHRIPISKGGPNEPWNMTVLCRACNLEKSDRMPDRIL